MATTIYIEGGANDSDALNTQCRRGFTKFFESAGLKGKMPKLVACGSRNAAFDKFKTALKKNKDVVLLIDSEAPVPIDAQTGKPISPWAHLKQRDKWDRPEDATDEHVHFMVQAMESWFVADKERFVEYYSNGNRRCNASAIPDRTDVEPIVKTSVFSYLELASQPSGEAKYSKGSRSFEILSITRPRIVANASYHLRRLLCHLGVTENWLNCNEF